MYQQHLQLAPKLDSITIKEGQNLAVCRYLMPNTINMIDSYRKGNVKMNMLKKVQLNKIKDNKTKQLVDALQRHKNLPTNRVKKHRHIAKTNSIEGKFY